MGQGLITLDTSGLLALLNRGDRDHEPVRTALFEDRGPYLVPAGILAEIAYMVKERLPVRLSKTYFWILRSPRRFAARVRGRERDFLR